jgi:hypothetical protein
MDTQPSFRALSFNVQVRPVSPSSRITSLNPARLLEFKEKALSYQLKTRYVHSRDLDTLYLGLTTKPSWLHMSVHVRFLSIAHIPDRQPVILNRPDLNNMLN